MLRKPTLKEVDPFKAFVLILLVAFNFAVGYSFFAGLARTSYFFIINEVLSYTFWGVIFVGLAVAMAFAYKLNNYRYMRIMLIVGLFVSLIWSVALSVRQIENTDTNILLLIFFAVLTILKFGLLLYFPAPRKVARG